MDPTSRNIAMGAAGGATALPEIGTFMEGGYFAGAISHTADGNPTHLLILSPKSSGGVGPGYGTSPYVFNNLNQAAPNITYSTFDGYDATVYLSNLSSNWVAARFAATRTINGYSDWYLPARYEFDIIWSNLKPTTQNNTTSWGANPYSVPRKNSNNTSTGAPFQTTLSAFQVGGSEMLASPWNVNGTPGASQHWLSEGFPGQKGAWYFLVSGPFSDAGGVSNTNINRVEPSVRIIRKVAV